MKGLLVNHSCILSSSAIAKYYYKAYYIAFNLYLFNSFSDFKHLFSHYFPVMTDWDPGPSKSRPFYSDYYPGPGNFQEQTGFNRDHFYKSVICSRL